MLYCIKETLTRYSGQQERQYRNYMGKLLIGDEIAMTTLAMKYNLIQTQNKSISFYAGREFDAVPVPEGLKSFPQIKYSSTMDDYLLVL